MTDERETVDVGWVRTGSSGFMGMWFPFEMVNVFWTWKRWWLHDILSVLNTTELFISKVNFTSIKKVFSGTSMWGKIHTRGEFTIENKKASCGKVNRSNEQEHLNQENPRPCKQQPESVYYGVKKTIRKEQDYENENGQNFKIPKTF